MPIVDLQQRYRELGRIRLGRKAQTQDGRDYPQRLETFRLTSPAREYIDRAAQVFGGKVQPWRAPSGQQWEVITDVDQIPVIVPAQDLTASQYYELWGSPGPQRAVTCLRRCDGRIEAISGQKCFCDPKDRECKPTTHLQVIIKALPDIGVWRATSHGINVAAEMPATVHTLSTLMRYGAEVDAILVTAGRTSTDKEGQRRHYRVLEVRIPHTTDELIAALPADTNQTEFVAALTAGPEAQVPAGRPALPETRPPLPATVEPVSFPPEDETTNAASPAGGEPEPLDDMLEEWIPPDSDDAPQGSGAGVQTELTESSLSVRQRAELEVAKLKGPARWDTLVRLVNNPPTDSAIMDDWRFHIRMVFGLMEKLGIWRRGESGVDALHIVLAQHYSAEHLSALRKDKLVELGKLMTENAQTAINAIDHNE